jgi:hypothetical protein
MDANFTGLCENVNNFSEDGIFANDTLIQAAIVCSQGRLESSIDLELPDQVC